MQTLCSSCTVPDCSLKSFRKPGTIMCCSCTITVCFCMASPHLHIARVSFWKLYVCNCSTMNGNVKQETHLPSVCSMKLPSDLHRRCTSPMMLPLSVSFTSHLRSSTNTWPCMSAVLNLLKDGQRFQLISQNNRRPTFADLGTCEPAEVSGTARRQVPATPPWQSAQLQPLHSALAAVRQTRLPTGSTSRLARCRTS